jgi:CRP-like cAMP-binding protein
MTHTVISRTDTPEGKVSPPSIKEQAGGLALGGTRSSVWATLERQHRPRDQRARRAPGGWGTRLEQSASPDPMGVFGPVRALDVRSLAGPVVDVDVPAGTQLVREGAPVGTFFVIRSGSADLIHGGHRVGTLGTGDCFGEIDPLGSQPQHCGVVTSSPTRLLAFSSFGISRLCDAIPGARARILDRLPERTAEVHSLAEAAAARAPRAAGTRAERRLSPSF